MEVKGATSRREHSTMPDSADHIEKLEQDNEHQVQRVEHFQ